MTHAEQQSNADHHGRRRAADRSYANSGSNAASDGARKVSQSTKGSPGTRRAHWKQAQQYKGCIEKTTTTIN